MSVSPSISSALNAIAAVAVSSAVIRDAVVEMVGASFTALIITTAACEELMIPSYTVTVKKSEPLSLALGV